MTKDKAILRAMEDAARKSGYKIRWDKGQFRGGSCTLDGSKLIVLNRHHPTEVHLGVLARALKGVPLQGVSIRKGMRKHVESTIQRYSFE
ncbi:MAG: hypothetical protein F4065_07830 [Rhodothermaceae bacterium]|nr:hypothetical protein [Bacteroidota bacterium]MXX96473.1 hypothetical protein [Rhodothermaceae bacterium]MDE2645174.1 hypothetical protein [Bacteroidota bacterium]MXZ59145.1 hypothetical protein [Rhodothermaceae bacterium]MYG45679.1 hypothetical protein [Rhodothermaceae bacterium]